MHKLIGAVAAMAGGWLLVASAASATPPPAKVKKFAIAFTGVAALEPVAAPVLGQDKLYADGDMLYSSQIVMEDQAKAASALILKVADGEWPVKEGAVLTRLRSARGGDLANLPATAAIYCADSVPRPVTKMSNTAVTLGLADVATRFDTLVNVCVVDSEANGTFDKGFLVGATLPGDLVTVDIAPVAYEARRLAPIEGAMLNLVYHKKPLLLGGQTVQFELINNGSKQTSLIGMSFPENAREIPGEDKAARKARLREWPAYASTLMALKADKTPQTYTVGSGRFTVTGVDPVNQTATIRIDKAPALLPFTPSYQTQTIYIYY